MALLPDPAGYHGPGSSRADRGQAPDCEVTDPRRITQILQRLCDARSLLAARLPGRAESYATCILGVDVRAGRLALDELTPAAGHEALLRDRHLGVLARLDGVEIAFQITLEDVLWERGIAVYTLPFPRVLRYDQRRTAHRVTVRAAPPLSIRLAREDGTEVLAEVRDISVGGLCLRTPYLAPGEIERGDHFPHGEIVLPDGRRLHCALEVRHVARAEGSRWVRIGVRFVDLPRGEQARIAHYIFRLEREHVRVRPPMGRER